jgi:uncharacterized protein with HEPN domain
MYRDYRLYLEDILEAAEKIEHYLKGVFFQEFAEDSMRVDVVLRNLEVIGEAVKRIPMGPDSGATHRQVITCYRSIPFRAITPCW